MKGRREFILLLFVTTEINIKATGYELVNGTTKTSDLIIPLETEITFADDHNRTALDESPKQLATGESTHNFEVKEEIEELNKVDPGFPINHRNITEEDQAIALEVPPLLNHFTLYQEQYKNYHRQKSEYGQKPIRFEENLSENHRETQGLGAYAEDNEDVRHKYGQLKHNLEPFPYMFENERIPIFSQDHWSQQNNKQEDEMHYYHAQEPENFLITSDNSSVKDRRKQLPGWKKVLKFFTTIVPLGLLLATFTPNIIYINSTVDRYPNKQRSLDERAKSFGGDLHESMECNKWTFCEIAKLGKKETGNYMEKSIWYLANEIPDDIAINLGLKELFQAIRTDNCTLFKCQIAKNAKMFNQSKKKKDPEDSS